MEDRLKGLYVVELDITDCEFSGDFTKEVSCVYGVFHNIMTSKQKSRTEFCASIEPKHVCTMICYADMTYDFNMNEEYHDKYTKKELVLMLHNYAIGKWTQQIKDYYQDAMKNIEELNHSLLNLQHVCEIDIIEDRIKELENENDELEEQQ